MSDCDNTDWIEYTHELESEIRTLQQRIAELELQVRSIALSRDELAATVESFHNALRHLYHNAKASGAEMGLALDVAEEALESTPQQNLNEVKREAIMDALYYSDGSYIETHGDYLDMITRYANNKYPIGKE